MTYKIIKRSEETDGRLGFWGPFPKHHHRIEALRLLPPLPQAGNGRREAAGEIGSHLLMAAPQPLPPGPTPATCLLPCRLSLLGVT